MPQIPLAETLRPKTIQGIAGQEHILGAGGLIKILLNKYVQTKFFPSLIFWGPPGCGKTTLARVVAESLAKPFFEFSAVNASTKDIEKVVPNNPVGQQKQLIQLAAPVVFIDEIHRFNKAQQDALLPMVEQGKILLFGATTENPSFEVIGPLLSRTRVVVMHQLLSVALNKIANNALSYLHKSAAQDTIEFTVQASNGDARSCINILEIAAGLSDTNVIETKDIKSALQKSGLYFDLKGEEFYNTISALHKSIRGSDPNAALYWLARMLEAGQDPLYIARRLIRLASEDVGLKDTHALVLATACFQTCSMLGMPECNLALAETVVYLAKSPKTNNLYLAYGKVAKDVHAFGNLPVPMHIRNAVTKLMKNVGYGKGYSYHHSETGEKDTSITYLPEELAGRKYIE